MIPKPPAACDGPHREGTGLGPSKLPLHVGRPNVGDSAALIRRMEEMLARGWLTNDGPLVKEFEGRIVQRTGSLRWPFP